MDVKKKLNPGTCNCENCKCLEGIIGDSVITCDKIIEVTKTVLTKTIRITMKKKGNMQVFFKKSIFNLVFN